MTAYKKSTNVFGKPLEICSKEPLTGYYRDGFCNTGPDDTGTHTVCAVMTKKFLEFTKSKGNNLITPSPPSFPGLKPNDRWCVCSLRWNEAHNGGVAPDVVMNSTNSKTLDIVPIEMLKKSVHKGGRTLRKRRGNRTRKRSKRFQLRAQCPNQPPLHRFQRP